MFISTLKEASTRQCKNSDRNMYPYYMTNSQLNVTCYTIYQKRGKAEERQNVKLVLALLPDTCTLKAVYWINYVSISISESLE